MKSFYFYILLFLSTLVLLSQSNEVTTVTSETDSDIKDDSNHEEVLVDDTITVNSIELQDTNSSESIVEVLAPSILPHIFVLNLDRATQRWENIQRVMSAADLSIERLSGIDGRQLSPQELTQQSSFLARTFQPRGVIGCYLSHRKFWQTIVDRNLDSAILFEDDVQLVPDFKNMLQSRLHQLKEDGLSYDVIFLGAIGMVHPQKRDSFFSRLFALYIGGCRKFCKINDYLYQPSKPAVSHHYTLTIVAIL